MVCHAGHAPFQEEAPRLLERRALSVDCELEVHGLPGRSERFQPAGAHACIAPEFDESVTWSALSVVLNALSVQRAGAGQRHGSWAATWELRSVPVFFDLAGVQNTA